MTAYSAADAANPAIVRAALETALVSGESRPRVTFGPLTVALDNAGTWTLMGWAVNLTTDQAVAAIVAARTGRN